MPIKDWTKIKVCKDSNLATILFQLPKHYIFEECNFYVNIKFYEWLGKWKILMEGSLKTNKIESDILIFPHCVD